MSGPALGVSASGARFSVALCADDGRLLGVRDAEARALSTELFAAVDSLLGAAGIRPAALAGLRVDRGPGSYTGLRVALTFARVLAEQAQLAVRHATSLELLAIRAWRTAVVAPNRPLRVILDARRERWHTARLEFDGACARLAEAPRAVTLDDLRGLARDDEALVVEPTAIPALVALGTPAPLPPYDAGVLFDPWLATRAATPAELEPLYLMGPYTERPA